MANRNDIGGRLGADEILESRREAQEALAKAPESPEQRLAHAAMEAHDFDAGLIEEGRKVEARYAEAMTTDEQREIERLQAEAKQLVEEGMMRDLLMDAGLLTEEVAIKDEEIIDPEKRRQDLTAKYQAMGDRELKAAAARLSAEADAEMKAHPERLKPYREALKKGKPLPAGLPEEDMEVNFASREIQRRMAEGTWMQAKPAVVAEAAVVNKPAAEELPDLTEHDTKTIVDAPKTVVEAPGVAAYRGAAESYARSFDADREYISKLKATGKAEDLARAEGMMKLVMAQAQERSAEQMLADAVEAKLIGREQADEIIKSGQAEKFRASALENLASLGSAENAAVVENPLRGRDEILADIRKDLEMAEAKSEDLDGPESPLLGRSHGELQKLLDDNKAALANFDKNGLGTEDPEIAQLTGAESNEILARRKGLLAHAIKAIEKQLKGDADQAGFESAETIVEEKTKVADLSGFAEKKDTIIEEPKTAVEPSGLDKEAPTAAGAGLKAGDFAGEKTTVELGEALEEFENLSTDAGVAVEKPKAAAPAKLKPLAPLGAEAAPQEALAAATETYFRNFDGIRQHIAQLRASKDKAGLQRIGEELAQVRSKAMFSKTPGAPARPPEDLLKESVEAGLVTASQAEAIIKEGRAKAFRDEVVDGLNDLLTLALLEEEETKTPDRAAA